MTDKRKKTEKYILDKISELDKYTDGNNVERYKKLFASMSDAKFDKFMRALKNNDVVLHMYIPNMKKQPTIEDAINGLSKLGYTLSERIERVDSTTDRTFLSNEQYTILRLPIRRQEQFQDKKMSIPSGDTKIDARTGQVTGDDRSARITNPEIQGIYAKGGLDSVIKEFASVRGGNVHAWSSEMKRELEETGRVSLRTVGNDSKNRSAVIFDVYLKAMLLENNISGGEVDE